jgi:hypothetical protein
VLVHSFYSLLPSVSLVELGCSSRLLTDVAHFSLSLPHFSPFLALSPESFALQYCLVQSTIDLGDGDEERETRKEGWRELEASYRLSADLAVSLARARGEEKEGLLAGEDGVGTGAVKTKPLRGAIGVLLAQAKAKVRSFLSLFPDVFSSSFFYPPKASRG